MINTFLIRGISNLRDIMNKAAMNILVLCTLKDTHTHTHTLETIAMNK